MDDVVTALPAPFENTGIDPRYCPKIKGDGKQCGNRAGKNTGHFGFGYCYKHGGSSPNGEQHGAKLAALAALPVGGGEVDIDPLSALLYTVRRAYGLAGHYRLHAEARMLAGESPEPYASLERQALGDLNTWAQRSVGAGVAERMARIAERTGETLAAALEDALAVPGLELAPAQRALVVQAFAAALQRLEHEQPALTVTASEGGDRA